MTREKEGREESRKGRGGKPRPENRNDCFV